MHVTGRTLLAPDASAASAPDPGPLVPTVFHEPWWLDIVTRRRWMDAEVMENGHVIGRLPFQVEKHFHGPDITMPPMTHFLGPALADLPGSRQARWLKQTAVTRELIRQLPPATTFWQKFHRGVTDVVPFQAERFETGVQFTFEVEPAPEDVLWSALRDKHRNVIRKARSHFKIEELHDSTEFTRLYQDNLDKKGKVSWAPADIMENLLAAAEDHGAGVMLGLWDAAGELAAAIFCPRDSHASYYTLSTRRPDCGNGAVPLLIWEGIRRAAREGRTFDFDGVSNEQSIGLYAGFDGVTSPRFVSARSAQSGLIRKVRRTLGLNTSTFGA